MAKRVTRSAASPLCLMEDLQWGIWRSYALVAGVELNVFGHIAAGKRRAGEIAAAAGVSQPAAERLLNALVGLRYLKKKGEAYSLESVAQTYLVPGGEFYMDGAATVFKGLVRGWSQLADVIRNGRPVTSVDSQEAAKQFFPALVRSIFPMNYTIAKAAAAAIPKTTRQRIGSILDVAAGSGAWSLAFARAIPSARVWALDYPEVTKITREFAQRFGVADRYSYIEGDLRQTDLGNGRYDLIILGHILHSEGEAKSRELIAKCSAALKDKGMLLIGEFVPNDRRTGPTLPLLFGLNMLIHTRDGNVFTMRQLRQWLSEAGFRKVGTIAAPAPSPLILAVK